MPEIIETVRFLVNGKSAPEGSRFKGVITADTIFGADGWFEYTCRKEAIDAETENDFVSNQGFLGYTSRENKIDGLTMSSMGYLDEKKKEEFRKIARAAFNVSNGICWDTVVSLQDYKTAEKYKLMTQDDYGKVVQRIMPEFFRRIGFDPENMIWWENYHKDKKNPHMHICFLEKKQTRTRGKITEKEMRLFKRMVIKNITAREDLKTKTDKSFKEFFKEKDSDKGKIIRDIFNVPLGKIETIQELYARLPAKGRLQYSSANMIPFREDLDRIAEQLLNHPLVQQDYKEYLNKLDMLASVMNEASGSDISTIKETEMAKLKKQIANIILQNFKQPSIGAEGELKTETILAAHDKEISSAETERQFEYGTKKLSSQDPISAATLNDRSEQKLVQKQSWSRSRMAQPNISALVKKTARALNKRKHEIEDEIELYLQSGKEK